MIEVSELQRHLDADERVLQNDEGTVHSGEDAEELGRSYVCSMSSAVDLECPMDGNYTNFALNVQRYLSCIVDELQLISAWSSSIYQRQATANPRSSEASKRIDESSFIVMTRLAVATDIELMRQDVAKAQHDLLQRCNTQVAYVQSEAKATIEEQDALYNELKQRMDDKQRVLDQQTQSIQALEKARTASDAQTRSITATLSQIQQETSTHAARISAIEKVLATVTTAQFTHEQELQTLQRRVERIEITYQLKVEATRRAVEDSVTRLRSANSQISSKMQVLRLEMQELNDNTQKRMQQLVKTLSSVAVSVPNKSLVESVATVAPRRPSMATLRIPRSGGNTHASQCIGTATTSGPFDASIGYGGAQTVMITGTDAVATTDCFIYAKAALPHRSSISETGTATKKLLVPSTGSSRAVTSPSVANETIFQSSITNLLTVQQSVMSLPLGYEDATRPMTSTELPKRAIMHPTRRFQ